MSVFVKPDRSHRGGSQMLSREFYTSPDVFREELDRIFERSWLCVGRIEEIASPGQYFLVEHRRESIIVLRDGEGTVRAFYNVCRHRGTRLCERKRGRFRETIQCGYHAWTYALDGSLVGAPHMEELDGFDKGSFPLRRVQVGEWGGFLFINFAEAPKPLAESLQPLQSRFAHYDLANLRAVRRIVYDVRANWKLIFVNFSECLHCPVIHPKLAKLSPYRSGKNDLTQGPILGGFMTIVEEGGSMTMSGHAAGPPVGDLTAEDRRRVYYYSVFPTMLLSPHPDYVMYHMLWPVSPERTRIVCEWLFPVAGDEQLEDDPDDAVRFWDMTNRQDWRICELGQAGIASRGFVPGPYSPRESLLAAWDEEYLRQLGRSDSK